MTLLQADLSSWLSVVQNELLLFAAVFFLIGAIDEFAVDLCYLFMRLTGRISTQHMPENDRRGTQLSGLAAVFIPTWQESRVIGETLSHALRAWKQKELRIYVGCYRNDAATLAAAMAAIRGDSRVRLVIHDQAGPTSKADCLNRLYDALRVDERRTGQKARMVILHDAEDMVDEHALSAMDRALDNAEFVQIPVLALPQSGSRWIAGHYSDEFAEAHGKTMVVRNALGAGIPGAGVGCAIARDMLESLAEHSPDARPFHVESLTEDYELGLQVKALGGRDQFLRVRTAAGDLVATRSYFPATVEQAIRQKTRWVHGIALQGWDRIGWQGGLIQMWMQLRDRRGPFAAFLLAIAYTLVALFGVSVIASQFGWIRPAEYSPTVTALLIANLIALAWRLVMRLIFTTREFGIAQGLCSIPRTFVSNWIAILAGRRAFFAYVRSLRGAPLLWDKTDHALHPAMLDRPLLQPGRAAS